MLKTNGIKNNLNNKVIKPNKGLLCTESHPLYTGCDSLVAHAQLMHSPINIVIKPNKGLLCTESHSLYTGCDSLLAHAQLMHSPHSESHSLLEAFLSTLTVLREHSLLSTQTQKRAVSAFYLH